MSDLISAFQIFFKYGNPSNPTHCNTDELLVMIDPELVSEEDKAKLDKLGFYPHRSLDCFRSYFFGSA
jgi:hypothetical protein